MSTLLPEHELKTFVDDTVMTVFDSMLAMEIEPSLYGSVCPPKESQVIGLVGLAGMITATVCLRVPESFSPTLTRAMMALEPGGPVSESDVNDVIGELTNIIAGKLKSCLPTKGPCSLSLPTIVHGRKIDLETVANTERHSFTFHRGANIVVVEYYALQPKEKTL